MIDARIGILCREGRTIYYAYDLRGRYVERYTLADMEHCLAARDGGRS